MNTNYIFFRYNNYNNQKDLELSPRTHISTVSRDNKKEEKVKSINKISLNKLRKLDSVEIGLQKLISLGRKTKKFIPSRESILYKKKSNINTDYLKSKSYKRLTPFQIYEKNKKLFSISLQKNIEKTLNLKSFNSKENTKSNETIFTTPNKNFHSLNCNFNNKLIKSLFEKNKFKLKLNKKIDLNIIKSELSGKKYLLSCGNYANRNFKRDKILNDFYIGNEKINKRIWKPKRKKEIYLYNNKHIFKDGILGNNRLNNNSKSEDYWKNIYDKIPLIKLNSYFSKKNFNLNINKKF